MKRKYKEANVEEVEPILDRISEARFKSDMTQTAAAKKLRMSRTNFSWIENGSARLTVNIIFELAKLYNVSPQWIFCGDRDD